MKINSLKLVNFRNYDKVHLQFNDTLNIICGNNGEGKTNLVEAIYVLFLTKSFRPVNEKFLIKKGEVSTRIEGVVEKNTENNYQVIINKDGKKVKIDNNISLKLSDYVTNIKVVILEPDAQMIFSDSPLNRRRMFNIEISQIENNYLQYLNGYNKILKQRNAYLKECFKSNNCNYNYLQILTEKLIGYGKIIYELRKKFVEEINPLVSKCYLEMFGFGNLTIKYNSVYNNKTDEDILKIYQNNYQKEISLNKTLNGIHHDDFIFLLDKENINEIGSNGQRKNAILAFKMAEIELIYQKFGDYPILILDDLFSALDYNKIKNIINLLNRNIQTFITTTSIEVIDEILLENAKLYNISDGLIEEV